MFCTNCGTELREGDNFCSACGAATGRGTFRTRPSEPLSRRMSQAKIAGVCAGFARSFGLDVTLVRVVWIVLCIWPVPLFGLFAYVVAWIVIPKDRVTAVQVHTANGPAVQS